MGQEQCKSGPANTIVSRLNHLLYHFQITMNLHLASLTRQNTLEKNYQGKMLIEQTIE